MLGYIVPHFCYNKFLSISGNCRICVVEIQNSFKPVLSCSSKYIIQQNNKLNKIFTNTPLIAKVRENILEFLLLNHPLDCPICDQGGECDLQDQSFVFGLTKKRFYKFKRVVIDKNIGPIIKTVMTRCIHCTKCIRFSNEIANASIGIGMLGRGFNSEIGTYVPNSVFQTELSGNVIDLCPVGALTSKPTPFTERSWELNSLNSFDFSDSFASPLRVYLKNQKIIKITPVFDQSNFTDNNPWITDKMRFGYEGMNPSERSLKVLYFKNKIKHKTLLWNILFKEITLLNYFNEHLSRHYYKNFNFVIIFDSFISLNNLFLLILLVKNIKFVKLRKFNSYNNAIDSEKTFLFNKLNTIYNYTDKIDTNLCLLFGVNTRYESPYLNINLKKKVIKNNFSIISFSSFIDLTYEIVYAGLNLKSILNLIEGSDLLCQNLLRSVTLSFIVGSFLCKQSNAINIFNIINRLLFYVNVFNFTSCQHFNLLNSGLNDSGINYINSFLEINENDFLNFTSFYFINTVISNSSLLKKIIDLKFLNYFFSNPSSFKSSIILEQNSGIESFLVKNLLPTFNACNYYNLPSNTFYEESNTYLNATGIFKKSVKILNSKGQTKNNWHIIRKMISTLRRIVFLTCENKTLFFESNIKENYKFYFCLNFFPCIKLNFGDNILNSTRSCFTSKFAFLKKKNKFFFSLIKLWLEDFYINGKDPYSKFSLTMQKCSKVLKLQSLNFILICNFTHP